MSVSGRNLRGVTAIVLMLMSMGAQAQGIKGKITDDSGNAAPGVAIYLKEIQTGGTSNSDGLYEIALTEGVYTLSFQALGYAKQEFRITVKDKWLELDVMLAPIQFRLQEVMVYSGEDPAYAIMRKAIGRTPFFRRQVKSYESEIYLKGSIAIHKMPKMFEKRIIANDASLRSGSVYTSESMNTVRFAAPDTLQTTVTAMRSSFPDEGSIIPTMDYINLSLYDIDNDLIISPLSPQAMRHYNFRYVGFFDDGKYTVNKIQVIPKRKSQQLLKGDLYIVENLWCIHSVDLSVETFIGTVNIRQLYSEVKDAAWLPVSHNLGIDASIMGIKGSFDYTGTVKYLSININEAVTVPALAMQKLTAAGEPENKVEAPLTKNQQKIETLLEKEDMTNRDMVRLATLIEKENKPKRDEVVLEITNNMNLTINSGSITRDSLFWNSMRPVPLTVNEKSGFAFRDSVKAVAKTKDSTAVVAKKRTGLKIAVIALLGTANRRPSSKTSLRYNGLIDLDAVNFNPVDGLKYSQSLSTTWKRDSVHQSSFSLRGGYAFARRELYGSFSLSHSYLHLRRGFFSFSGHIDARDFNESVNIHRLVNMASTLLFKENYPRYYDDRRLAAHNSIDLANGLQLNISAEYQWASPLANSTEFSFLYRDKKYKPNTVPDNTAAATSNFDTQRALTAGVRINYTPRQRYYMFKGRKIMHGSDYPTFTFGLEQGIKGLGSSANYLVVDAGVSRRHEVSFSPVFSWNVNGGYFIVNRQLHFSHFRHFNASTIPLLTQSLNDGFFLFNSYETSTSKWYIKANATYSSPFLLIKYLPFFSNRLWNENFHAGYLHTPDFPNHIQAGYSISQIFMFANAGVFVGFNNWQFYHWGVRIALDLF